MSLVLSVFIYVNYDFFLRNDEKAEEFSLVPTLVPKPDFLACLLHHSFSCHLLTWFKDTPRRTLLRQTGRPVKRLFFEIEVE